MTGSEPEDLLADRLLPPTTSPVAAERNPSGWKCMPFIIGNEAFEKVASDGLTANLTVYLVKHFNMEQVAAVNVGNVFSGTVNLTPLIGAFISDAYFGRFRTLACGSVVSILGMVAMTLTSIIPQLQPPSCTDITSQAPAPCKGPSTTQLAFLYFSMALLAAGAGGVRPCSLPFGVDQFDAASQKGKIELNSFFNWYYCTSSVGTLIGLTLVVYIQDSISWPLGFAIPTFLMLLSILVFFLGAPLYVHVRPEGSVFSSFAQVFVASYKKKKLELELNPVLYDPPANTNSSRFVTRLSRTDQLGFLDRAAMICVGELDSRGCSTNPWMLCSVQQVEEVKCLLRIIPIWASGVVCYLSMAQWGFVVLQSLQMDRTLGRGFHVPAGSMFSVGLITVILFIPIYDRLFVPAARRITGLDSGVTLLQRQGAGMVLFVLSMVVSGGVEERRRSSAVAGAPPMSVMWLVPQLVVTGVAVALNVVGQIEFYNRQFPEHMQTLAGSLFCCSVAGASYLSTVLVTAIQRFGGSTSWLDDDINKGRLDYFYYLIAAMGVVNFLYFLVCSRYYRYKGM